SRNAGARYRHVRGGVQPDQADHHQAEGGRQRESGLPRRQEWPADRRPWRDRQSRHHLPRLPHSGQRRRHRWPGAPERRAVVLAPLSRRREGQQPRLGRGKARYPRRDFRRAQLAGPREAPGEEGVPGAGGRVRPDHGQGREGKAGSRCCLRKSLRRDHGRRHRQPLQRVARAAKPMTFINYASREINCKIVYYGPGLCGKTTNLQYIYDKTNPPAKGKLTSLATETDRTLFFDFLPLELGTVRGFKTRFHLYTVPGQVFYDASRKLILKGVDGVIFVADSQVERMD